LDGNGWSSRFKRLITSNSLIFKATIYPEWCASSFSLPIIIPHPSPQVHRPPRPLGTLHPHPNGSLRPPRRALLLPWRPERGGRA
ncbi:hypothetical protein C0991_003157, partial [Blastosporella zonata]